MDISLRVLAEKVVRDSLRVTSSDVVVVNTWDWTSDLASALALECYRLGADVLMTLYTDDFYFEHLKILSEEDLRQTSRHCLELADYTSVEIFIGGPEDHSRFKDIPASKTAANAQGEKVHWEKSREKRIRTAALEFSTVHPRVAKTYRFDYSSWKKILQSAVMVDYREVSEFGARLASTLEKGRNVSVKQGNETDLRFEIAGRIPYVSDGVIDEADIERGKVFTSIPAGTVSVAPVETTASGRVRFDLPLPRSGKLIRGIEWKLEQGRLVSFNAKQNLNAVKDCWEIAKGDKDRIGSLILGINPRARFGFNIDSLVRGAVSIGMGENRQLGGENNTDFSLAGTLGKATVELDGTPIIKNGRFVI